MQWHDITVGGQDTTGLSLDGQDTTGLDLDLPCTEDPELFFAESPQDVEQAKAMCRGCRAGAQGALGRLGR
jgi:WhiB family transcriptional regulator, redox-sensing transcriptional regulator